MRAWRSFFAVCFVMAMLVSGAYGDVALIPENFPDDAFRFYLLGKVDANDDGVLSDTEIEAITSIEVTNNMTYNGKTVRSLKGIEYFINLKRLWCKDLQLTSLDVRHNTALTELDCGNNQLTELDVSYNTALTELGCLGNQLTTLDVSHNTALTGLDCVGNQLTELDVSHNTALTELCCYLNQLTTLDVSHNTALTKLYCWGNQLTELDLSNNTALKALPYSPQTVYGLKNGIDINLVDMYSTVSGTYRFDLLNYVARKNLQNVSDFAAYDSAGNPIDYEFDSSGGVITSPGAVLIYGRPSRITYAYDTGRGIMQVNIIESYLDIAAFERGRDFEYLDISGREVSDYGGYEGYTTDMDNKIICGVSDDCYLNINGEPVTEEMIATITDDYKKIGLTADGNTRLIIRVQTKTPGYVSFSVPDDTGLTIETLDRQKLNGESMVHNTLISNTIFDGAVYQVSVVLTAPEAFPQSKARLADFPMTKFNVSVEFRPDEGGGIQRGTLPLELHATPVMLLHGRTSTVNDTFGTGREGYGIKRQLWDAGFQYYGCDYDGYQGPSYNIASPNNAMRNKIAYIINGYNYDKIACSRVDIVAHSMGGLMARQFLINYMDMGNKTIRSYKQISVRRIVTVATPHNGSQEANYLLWTGSDELLDSFKSIKPVRGTARRAFVDKREHPVLFRLNPEAIDYEGDLIDLAMGSRFLQLLNKAEQDGLTEKVPMYAIYGRIKNELKIKLDTAVATASLSSLVLFDPLSAALVLAFDALAIGVDGGMDVMFQGEDYDIAVGESSARYGMEGYCEAHTGTR